MLRHVSLIDQYSPVLRYFSASAHALVTLTAEGVIQIQGFFGSVMGCINKYRNREQKKAHFRPLRGEASGKP